MDSEGQGSPGGLPTLAAAVGVRHPTRDRLLRLGPVGRDDAVAVGGLPGASKSANWRRRSRLQARRKAAVVFSMLCTEECEEPPFARQLPEVFEDPPAGLDK